MVGGLSCDCVLAVYNRKVNDVNQQFRCNSCLKYKCELEEMAEEPSSTRKIIQLLHDDLNTFKGLMLTSPMKEATHI